MHETFHDTRISVRCTQYYVMQQMLNENIWAIQSGIGVFTTFQIFTKYLTKHDPQTAQWLHTEKISYFSFAQGKKNTNRYKANLFSRV